MILMSHTGGESDDSLGVFVMSGTNNWRPFLLAWAIMIARASAGDFPAPYDSQDPLGGPTPPETALAGMKLPAGFHASLFATEPDVRQPIAMTFDSRGRLWVAENYSYSESKIKFDKNLRDRILIFEDTDHDGRFDKRTVFWDQGFRLSGIEVGFGGVWATAPPYLLFLPDRDGDDVPDGEPVIETRWLGGRGDSSHSGQWPLLGARWLALWPTGDSGHVEGRSSWNTR